MNLSTKELLQKLEEIPVQECGEPLLPIPEISGKLRLDLSAANEAWLTYRPDFRLRASVNERLVKAAKALPPGFSFLIKEALRPLAIQGKFWANYIAKLKLQFPHSSTDELHAMAWEFVAPPGLAVHPTGAAVDLTLCDATGVELDLGTPYDADPISSAKACYTAAQNISEEAKRHRAILAGSMSSVDFYNFPFEWWHWSYGDREWAFNAGAGHAYYGVVA